MPSLRMLSRVLLLLTVLMPSAAWAQSANTNAEGPQPNADLPPALRTKLKEIDQRLAKVKTLQSRFTKERTTALLKRPLTSHGHVRMAGGWVRWDTDKPSVSQTLITDDQVRILYPQAKRMEIYPLRNGSAQFGVGPMPRMTELAQRFKIRQIDPRDLLTDDEQDRADDFLALALTPRSKDLAEHLAKLTLLIDTEAGFIRRFALTQPGGTTTRYTFDHVQLNPEFTRRDLALDPPAGTDVTYPYGKGGDADEDS